MSLGSGGLRGPGRCPGRWWHAASGSVTSDRRREDCQIGPDVQLLTPTRPTDPQQRRDKLQAALPISIGNNEWLGGGVIVGPGVSIGDDSVIGAGSVVIHDIPPGVVAVGNPAKVIRDIAPTP